ncbi:MAG: LTA synthase family protein [Actinomycetota bacterium]|nr:LTA synthase family protein [Actinomycetota bacterium]
MTDRTDSPAALQAPSVLVGGLHLAALWTIAVVQPLLNLLGSNPDFFVARDDTGGQIILFAVLLVVAPPAVATLIESGLNLFSRTARWFVHLGFTGILFAAIALQFLKQFLDGPAVPMILIAVALGSGLTWAYANRRFMRSLTDILVIAPPVVLIVFLFFSQVSELTLSVPEVRAKEVSIGNPAPVVMVVFDEFPAGSLMTPSGQINGKRYPNFDELARTGTWYRNTTTNASYTAIAVPSILTGQPADRHGLPTAADHPDSIFTLLGGSYRVRAVEPITQLCPEDICGRPEGDDRDGMLSALTSLADDLRHVSAHLLLPASMGSSLPDISQSFQGFGGESVESIERGRARQWVRDRLDKSESSLDGEADLQAFFAELDTKAKRTLDFVHVEEPHIPWTHFPSGRKYAQGGEDFRNFFDENSWFADRYMTDRGRQAHLLEVGFADDLLGRVISRLKRSGRWNETLFVVTADHGGSTVPGLPRRDAHPATVGSIGMVPLFIKEPGQKQGRTVTRPTCTTEIVPAMARALRAPLDWDAGQCDRENVTIDNGTGSVVSIPFSRAISQRKRYVNELSSLFGPETGWDGVLKLGPDSDLIGRRLSSMTVAPASDGESARPELGRSLGATWRPGVKLNPVLRQRGSLNGIEPGRSLVVAAGGKIVAAGESYEELGKTRYSILLPESALVPGFNRISLYSVDSGTLRELWASDDQ